MAKAIPDRALAALLSFEDKEDGEVSAEDALPTLNERVELFLRAKYGEDRIFSASERAAARARILDAMAGNSASEANTQVGDVEVLAALIGYSGEEAVRLDLPVVVIDHLRNANLRISLAATGAAARARISEAMKNNSAAEVNAQVRDVEALVALIGYCEGEAVRLDLPAAAIESLQKASEELTKTMVAPLMSARVDDFRRH